jgi:hypothetical protein
MIVTSGTRLYRYDEKVHPGMRLGRHEELDAKSVPYFVRAMDPDKIKPSSFEVPIGILDQGNLGSCVGNATTYHLSNLFKDDLSWCTLVLKGKRYRITAGGDNQPFAVASYHFATTKDGFRGVYPPDDTGSSGIGSGRAMKAQGLIEGYDWATSLLGVATLLQRGGVLIGMPWYDSMFDPDRLGFIDNRPDLFRPEYLAGGHELYLAGLETWYPQTPEKSVAWGYQSWGGSWGDAGRFRMRLSTWVLLRKMVDVKQFRRQLAVAG